MANPVTHLEKTIAGEVSPVTHLEKVIAEYGGGNVYENLEAGTNILIEETADGKAKISASGEVSSEDTVARADIAAIKDGTNIDSFGDVETALATKANTATTYTKTEVDTALGSKQDTISDLSTIRSGAALGATAVQPETGKGLSTNDYTNTEKSKLAGIEAQANKTTVDDALSGSSTNPVQNKVVKSALDGKANASTTYTKTEVDTALSGKQATLTSAQLEAANSGITSANVAQITTNKNNISKNAAELVELVDNGAKSLVDFPSINPIAVRSSYTTITDGYTITGNASAAYPYMALPFTNFKAGNYVLKITVSAFTGADASIYVKKGDYSTGTTIASQTITQTGDISVPFTLDTDSAEMGIAIYPNMKATETQQTMTVSKLMICTQAAWDVSQKYVPYRPTYEETVEQVAENENNILFNANNGVKNLLKNTAVSTVNNTVTFTVNDDKSIRVQGKPSSGVAEIVLSDLSELVDGQTYKLYGNQATNRTSFQIIGGSGIANIFATEAGTDFTFIRANYVRAVVRTQADAQTTDITIKPMITIPTMDGSTYQPNAKTNVELTNLTEEARTIYVGANEKFTKLTDAMKYAFEHKNTIVRVGAGTYDIISEMGNSYWTNFTDYTDLTHARIGNGSHFIFSPDSKVVCEYTGDNTNVNQLYSPFNSLDGNEGSFTLEGLTLVVSGCRYAIHDDTGASTVRQTHKYINCEITNDKRCIGAGLGADETVEMRDCIFHSTGAVGNSPVSWHNSGGGTTGKGSIVMTGCYVDGAGDNAVQFLAYGVSPKETNVIVSNNSFNAAPSCRKYDETIQYMNFKMLDFNNEIRT